LTRPPRFASPTRSTRSRPRRSSPARCEALHRRRGLRSSRLGRTGHSLVAPRAPSRVRAAPSSGVRFVLGLRSSRPRR
jgi:hypothetical protein